MSRGLRLRENRAKQLYLKFVKGYGLRVTGGPNEEEACVDSEIGLLSTLGLLFLSHVGFMLVINEVDDRSPRVTVIDVVSKARRINNGEFDLEGLFLQLRLDNLDLKRNGS